jgi:hypothetical protein
LEGAVVTAKPPFENLHERGPGALEQEHELVGAPAVRRRPPRWPEDDVSPADEPPPRQRLTIRQRWFYPDRETFRRTLIGIGLTVVALGVGVWLTWLMEPDDPTTFYWLLAALGVGAYIRARTAVWATYLGLVIPTELFVIGQYLYLGGAEWAERNQEHWQGDESPLFKLTGQLIELAIFGVIFALLAGLGALIAHWMEEDREIQRRRGWRDSGGSQSPV